MNIPRRKKANRDRQTGKGAYQERRLVGISSTDLERWIADPTTSEDIRDLARRALRFRKKDERDN